VRAASGQAAAAPPSSVMNACRLMSDIGLAPAEACIGLTLRKTSLPQRGYTSLGQTEAFGLGFGAAGTAKY